MAGAWGRDLLAYLINISCRLSSNSLYISLMSSKKIIRLKMTSPRKEAVKSPQSAFGTHIQCPEETSTRVQTSEYTELLQTALINEINKLYKDIQQMKLKAAQEHQILEELQHERKKLNSRIEFLQKDSQLYRQMYELQRENHGRLRKFYETREKEWVFIVNQHRLLLQEYDQRFGTQLSIIKNHKRQENQLEQPQRERQGVVRICTMASNSNKEVKQSKEGRYVGERRRLKGGSLYKNLSQRKLKRVTSNRQEVFYCNEMHRLYEEESRFCKRSQLVYQNIRKNESKVNVSPQNAANDEIFDRMIRQTYYKYKECHTSIGDIQKMEDMLKLKSAKTSTRQRLPKTIKRLDFQINNEEELKIICEYIERAVIERHKVFRGDYAFNLLINKLKECERFALELDSDLQRLDKKRSAETLDNEDDAPDQAHNFNVCNNYYGTINHENIMPVEKISQQNLELLLNSTIKRPNDVESIMKKGNESLLSENVRYSVSEIQNLSNIFNCDTDCGTPQKCLNQKEETRVFRRRR